MRIKILIYAALIIVVFSLPSCKGDEPTPIERNTKLLTSGTWIINYVKADGIDRTDLFTGFKITFHDKTYTAENGGPIWGSSSTWEFISNTADVFTLGPGIAVNINEISATSMNLSLSWNKTTIDGGRSKSVAGTHEFQFMK